MNTQRIATEFALSFVMAFVVTAVVSFLYSLVVHGEGIVDWGTAVRLGIIFGILLTWMANRSVKKKND